MKRLVLGPTFEFVADGDAGCERLTEWIASDMCPFEAAGVGSHFQLSIRPESGRRFWSPWLTLDVRDGAAGTVIFGRFNPSPGVWTGYILSSLALITVALGGAMWGLSQMMLGRSPWAFAVIPVCAAVGGAMWWVSAFGQRMAREEMQSMEDAVRDVFG